MLGSVLSMIALVAAPAAITNPDWKRIPSADEMSDHYPERARNVWLEGGATIVCRISVKGRLNNCEVVAEDPEGFGFGAAALGLSGLFEMTPQMKDGQPVESGSVRIPIRFRLPQLEMSDLDASIQCYGLLGAKLDAGDADPDLVSAVKFLKDNLTQVAARATLSWDSLRAAMAAARTAPTRDPALVAACDQELENWKAAAANALR